MHFPGLLLVLDHRGSTCRAADHDSGDAIREPGVRSRCMGPIRAYQICWPTSVEIARAGQGLNVLTRVGPVGIGKRLRVGLIFAEPLVLCAGPARRSKLAKTWLTKS